jgi:hypothetical protein
MSEIVGSRSEEWYRPKRSDFRCLKVFWVMLLWVLDCILLTKVIWLPVRLNYLLYGSIINSHDIRQEPLIGLGETYPFQTTSSSRPYLRRLQHLAELPSWNDPVSSIIVSFTWSPLCMTATFWHILHRVNGKDKFCLSTARKFQIKQQLLQYKHRIFLYDSDTTASSFHFMFGTCTTECLYKICQSSLPVAVKRAAIMI